MLVDHAGHFALPDRQGVLHIQGTAPQLAVQFTKRVEPGTVHDLQQSTHPGGRACCKALNRLFIPHNQQFHGIEAH